MKMFVYCEAFSYPTLSTQLYVSLTTMPMPFSAAAAAAAALDATSGPTHGLYSHSTEVGFLMKSNANKAPAILSLILAKLVLDEPSIVMYDAANSRISQAEMPTDKVSSDDIFSVTSSASQLTCRVEIQSDRRTFIQSKWESGKSYRN
jgi:hypothetical protein